MNNLKYFKAYDIRGKLGIDFNENTAYKIGRAFAQVLKPVKVIVGSDSRLTSESLKLSLARGLTDEGVDVIDIGLSGTEEIYFATSFLEADGGIEVTASHNPIDYNGMKIVGKNSTPVSRSSGLSEMEQLIIADNFLPTDGKGSFTELNILKAYADQILKFININNLKDLKLVINSGNGAAGHVIDCLESRLKETNPSVTIIKINNEPDGTFPKGIPNPLLPECREETSLAVIKHKADIGIAFDGDFDRCFFFDEEGNFIEGYYIVGLLAEAFLKKNPGSKIIHDPRLCWNTIEVVESAGGVPIESKTGHAFIKEVMREQDAIYGGEMSAHHYFRDFFYCDSGMIPWLLIAELVSIKNTSLSALVDSYIKKFPSSGEINVTLANPEDTINQVRLHFMEDAIDINHTDGLSMSFSDWRFNLRSSNTEPLIRLNVETKGNLSLLKYKTSEILTLLSDYSSNEKI